MSTIRTHTRPLASLRVTTFTVLLEGLNNVLGPAGQWTSYDVDLSWIVTDTNNSYPEYPWRYECTFTSSCRRWGPAIM